VGEIFVEAFFPVVILFAFFVKQILDAVEYFHGRGLMHRDLKVTILLCIRVHQRFPSFKTKQTVIANLRVYIEYIPLYRNCEAHLNSLAYKSLCVLYKSLFYSLEYSQHDLIFFFPRNILPDHFRPRLRNPL